MKEILSGIWATYKLYFDKGRLIPLFAAALIILIIANRRLTNRVRPILFFMSLWTAVSHAFTILIASVSGAKKKARLLLASLFCFLMVVVSGTPIWSADHLKPYDEIRTEEKKLDEVCETILNQDPHAKILASPEVMLSLCARSSEFVPLYTVSAPGKADELPEEEHMLLEAFSDMHPDFEQIHRLCHKQGRVYVVVDSGGMWPEHDYMPQYERLSPVDQYDIYAYSGELE